MNLKLTVCFALFCLSIQWAQAQTQTIRGTLVDKDSKFPLIGASIRVVDTDPIIGTVTDLNGEFRIENIPYGRVNLMLTYIGYEEQSIPNVLVTAAKEVVLHLEMTESVEKLAEVVVTAQKEKGEVLNEMAMISARSFSVEETQRYAGSFSDPARMASSFAGVAPNAEGNNDIVVRGNSPQGILWRLEGVEIPNPNHFANDGSTGGPVNALNSYMLDNSDFYTGAFAPEYGNAMSGVFDIRFKKGNNQTREYTASASMLGIDFTAEGPFSQNYNGSYIANFRYSSLQLLNDLGIVDFGGVPKYKDASFNVYLPIDKNNFISVFGLGGISSINAEENKENGDPAYRGYMNSDLGFAGMTYVHFYSEKASIKNTISVSGTRLNTQEELVDSDNIFFRDVNTDITKSALRFASTFNYKISAQHKVETGVILSRLGYQTLLDLHNYETKSLERVLNDDGSTATIQGFTSWKYRINEDWTLTSGLHYLYFALNGSSSVEPRAGLKWQFSETQSLTAGFGIHSRLSSVSTYLARTPNENGGFSQLNKDLKPGKAAHFVLGYGMQLSPLTHLKAEIYYQHLYQVPIGTENMTYSILNESDWFITEQLTNKGTGRNYGVEFSLERYFSKGYYFMSTASLYQSLYTAGEGIERSTAFNGNYILNFTGGKEFPIGNPAKNKVMFINAKAFLLGASRMTPIDLEASKELGDTVYDTDKPYSQRGDDVFALNVSVGTRKNKKNTTREFKIDITNVTNNKAVVKQYYISPTQEIENSTQLPFIPNIVYAIKF